MAQYVSQPLSRNNIRDYALKIRRSFQVQDLPYFPIIQLFEIMPILFGKNDFYTEIVDDDAMPPNIHAEYLYEDNCIQVKRSVHDGAYDGSGRDRMTLAHEIGHYLLIRQSGLRLCRSYDESVPTFQDPEWQAKCFAGELLIPAHLVRGMTAAEIAEKCGVSREAAAYQMGKIK